MSILELATGPGWGRRFGLTWASAAILVAAGLVQLVGAAVRADDAGSAPSGRAAIAGATHGMSLGARAAPSNGDLAVSLLGAPEGAEVEVRVLGCIPEEIRLSRQGDGFPVRISDLPTEVPCTVQARRRDGAIWTRWTLPTLAAPRGSLDVTLPRERAGGIGAILEARVDAAGARVMGVPSWSAAWEAGLEPGDVILAANGLQLGGLTTEDQIQWITGPVGTTAVLDVRDHRTGKIVRLEIERRPIAASSVQPWGR